MNTEPNPHAYSNLGQPYGGWIEVITGAMFSGKTEELIRRLNRAWIAGQKVEIFKPSMDKRYHARDVVSHDQRIIRSTAVDYAEDMYLYAGRCDVVGIDEAQFFDDEIVATCNRMANEGKRVVIAGLDMDFEGKPFGPMPQLLAIAEYVTKLHAICKQSGGLAHYSYRLQQGDKKLMPGGREMYEPRSRKFFFEGLKARERGNDQ